MAPVVGLIIPMWRGEGGPCQAAGVPGQGLDSVLPSRPYQGLQKTLPRAWWQGPARGRLSAPELYSVALLLKFKASAKERFPLPHRSDGYNSAERARV